MNLNSHQSIPKYHNLMSPQGIPICSSQQTQLISPLPAARPINPSAITHRSVSPIHQQFNIIHPNLMQSQPKQVLEMNSTSVPLSQRVFSVEIQQTSSVLQPFRNVLQPKQTNIIRSCSNLNGIQPLGCPPNQILKANNSQLIPLPMQSMKMLHQGQFLIPRGIKNQENGDPMTNGQIVLPSNKTHFQTAIKQQYPHTATPFQQQISSNIGSQKVISVKTINGLQVSNNKQIINRHSKSASCHSKITGNNQIREQQMESLNILINDKSQLKQLFSQQKQSQQQINHPKSTQNNRKSSFTLNLSKQSNVEIQIKSVGNDQESTQTQVQSYNEIIPNHSSRACQTEQNFHKNENIFQEKIPITERILSNNESEIIARMVDNDIQEILEQYKVQINETRDDKTLSTPDRQVSKDQDLTISDTIQLLNKQKDEKVKQSKPILTYNLTPVHFDDHCPTESQELKEQQQLSSQNSLTERQSKRNKSPVHQIYSDRKLNQQQQQADTTQDKSISKELPSNDDSLHQTPQKFLKQQEKYDKTNQSFDDVADQQINNPSAKSTFQQTPCIIQRTPDDRQSKNKLKIYQPQVQLQSESQEQMWSLEKLEKEAENIKNTMSPELYFTLKDMQGHDSTNREKKLKCLQSDIEKRVEGALPDLKQKEVKNISQAIYDSVFHLLRKKYSINVARQAGSENGNNKKQVKLETRGQKNKEKIIEQLSKGRFNDARDTMKRNKARSLSTQGLVQINKFCLSPIQEMESFAEQLQASKFTTEKKNKNEEDKGDKNNLNRQIKSISSWEDNIKQIKQQVEATTSSQNLAQKKLSSKISELAEQPTIELSIDNNNYINNAVSPQFLSNYHLPFQGELKRSQTPIESAKSNSFFGQISCITINNQNTSNQNIFSECNIPELSYPDILLPSSTKMNLQFKSANASPNNNKKRVQQQESSLQNTKGPKNVIQSTPKSQQVSSISLKKTNIQAANTKENYAKEYLRKCSKDKKKKEENDYQRIKSTLMANFQKAQQGHLKELQQTIMKGISSRRTSRSEHTQY